MNEYRSVYGSIGLWVYGLRSAKDFLKFTNNQAATFYEKSMKLLWFGRREWMVSMTLNVRNRVPTVDILQIDYEYCTISYYTEGTRNDLGEPSRTLTERAANVKCSIDPGCM